MATSDSFFVKGVNEANAVGYSYVAYVFANDAPMFGPNGDESIIKCGTAVRDETIDLGWEPQWVLIKRSDGSQSWHVIDNARGFAAASGTTTKALYPNVSSEEADSINFGTLSPTGFVMGNYGLGDFIYMAIRRPNKPAKEFEPDELFGLTSATSNAPWFKAGFPVDMAWRRRYDITTEAQLSARLIDESYLKMNATDAATSSANRAFDFSNGWYDFSSDDAANISWMFRRAPGFFDVVTYEGDGVDDKVIPHNLQAVPEMFWMKSLSTTGDWFVYNKDLPLGYSDNYSGYLSLNSAAQASVSSAIRMSGLTDESLMCSPQTGMNQLGVDYITYLFASVPGICDIGSYTGTGADRDIDCGFSNGARFVLIKRYEGQAGSWYYFDTVRGIVTRSSPTLYLNDTQAQATDPKTSISPLPAGFSLLNSLDSEAANYLNTTGHKYIYMAIA
jgi:hypothetical protein